MWPIKLCELDPDFICSKSSKYYSIWLCKCITTESPQHQPPREPKHTCSAVLKRKLTIEPIRPGSIARVHWSCFLTKRFQPFSQSLAGAFQIVGESADDNSYCDSGGKKDCSDSHAIFLKISLVLSKRGRAISLSAICVCKSASSSFLSATLASGASFSEGEVFSSWMIISSFWRRSSLSHS